MSQQQHALDLISTLIYAATWAERRRGQGESGTKAMAMVRRAAGHLFTSMTGKEPTKAELDRLVEAANEAGKPAD